MLRMLFWTAATATAVLGLLWAAHHFVPAVSGLGDLNDVMGITAGVCAVITLVLFFVPRRGARGEESRTGGTTNRI
ncbi:hypothetical protein, partial [Nocardiopsis baichengensis]|uniref:hypothetical protein n=1 Tax=Nocardiopsis baichengensis TaxID=280240 RepID=UPI000592BD9C